MVFDNVSLQRLENRFQSIARYIDEHFVDACESVAYGDEDRRGLHRRREMEIRECAQEPEAARQVRALDALRPCAPMAISKSISLEDMLKQADVGFSEALLKRIDEAGKKDSEIYKKAHISKQHFSKIRNNPRYQPTKATAIAFALALELDVEQTNDLIGRAGYTLTNSSKFDLIIRYFIEQGNYNVAEINIALYEFDQSLLGA